MNQSKKSDAPKASAKELMDYSDKQLDKAEKTIEKKALEEHGDFSIESSKLEEPEQAPQAPKVDPKPVEAPKPVEVKKEEPKPVEKKEESNTDFTIVTDRLTPEQAPAAPVAPATVPPPAAAQKPVETPKPAEAPKAAETKKDDTKKEIEKMKDQLSKSDKGVEENLKKAS